MNRGFLKAGHLPTLVAAFLYFDLSFMVWVMLGPLGVQIARDLQLGPAEKGLLVATPVIVVVGLAGVLVYTEYVTRAGPKVRPTYPEYAARFAAWRAGLGRLFQIHRLVRHSLTDVVAADLPPARPPRASGPSARGVRRVRIPPRASGAGARSRLADRGG